jgi:superoxide dismutase
MLQKVVEYIGSFEAFSRDAIVQHLDAFGSNWKWTVPREESGDYVFHIARQPLQSTSIVHAAHSSRLDGVVVHDVSQVCIVFVLAGEGRWCSDRHVSGCQSLMPLLLGSVSVPGRIRACTFQHSIEDGAADGDLRLLGAE